MFGFPSFLLSLLVVAIIGVGLWNVVFAVGLASIPHFARIIRSAALQVKEQPYIEACVNMGFGKIRIMFNHILPNIFPIIIAHIERPLLNPVFERTDMTTEAKINPTRYPPVTPKK